MLIGKNYHVECLWLGNHAPCQVINEKFLVTQSWIGAHSFRHNCAEAAIGARQYGILGPQGHAASIASRAAIERQFTGRLCHTMPLLIGTDPHGVGPLLFHGGSLPPGSAAGQRAWLRDIALARRVQALQVVTHDDIIDALGMPHRTTIARIPPNRSDIYAGLFAPAQIPKNRPAWSTTRSEERTVRGVDSVPRLVGERIAIAFQRLAPTQHLYKANVWR